MRAFRQIVSFLFLGIFLFAWGAKTVHVLLEEHEEVVCKETSHHFHESEEKCFICEFDLQLAEDIVFYGSDFSGDIKSIEKVFYYCSFTHVKFNKGHDSRGPPSLG